MVLVDYSESDASASESEAPPKPAPAPKAAAAAPKKQAFQKVVDRSNRGKITVSLPQQVLPATGDAKPDEPPAKRARTSGATVFSGFNSMLPAPKNAAKAGGGGQARRPGVALKTSAEPGFRRGGNENEGYYGGRGGGDGAAAEAEQKPADEVKLVGKPLMFRPLSVARTAKKKKGARVGGAQSTTPSSSAATQETAKTQAASASAPPPAKKVSLFSLHSEEPQEPATTRPAPGGAYEPLFEAGPPPEPTPQDYAHYAAQTQHGAPLATTGPGPDSLDSIADDLQLSAAARRQLFGRDGGPRAAKHVINFNTDQEYQHNETVRAAGEQQIHQPVRALQGGKHSLRQLVQNVHNQREALEDSFAKGKSNRKEASSRYGW
ncbi:mitotic checkpoint regulator, MAD2B-interacting domain-containing protein [Hirsutella rhossiliensis]|uniref:Mitotic checkpoint regulator, MAD2B-interacting domain-containing protein n=1 Tax=Hirsutella rhossiliensis TaxID=111463 RepID=A0A9P8SIV7_9HYPO|nr:mitotic checkpoint regulator, MAD2B-interacting domain-containing protein [Hirsutella rhossiliensis]KAH0963589.1 mitotic checkpoint regulator, MAD2B-interacting domain-containing protein [Hirsutella rhossiliensis]